MSSQSIPTINRISPTEGVVKYRDRIPSLLIDSATLVLLVGMIGNIAANSTHWSSGSFTSTYTVVVLIAALLVNAIRRFSKNPINMPIAVTELATLFFLGLVLSNPIRWGLPAIIGTLLAWIVVSGLRYLVAKPYTWLTALRSLFILIVVAVILNAHINDVTLYSGQVQITDATLFPVHGPALVILCGWVCVEGLVIGLTRNTPDQGSSQ